MYTSTNIKHKKNRRVVCSVLPVCAIAIKLGHAGIVDPAVSIINTSLQKHVKQNHQHTSSGNQERHLKMHKWLHQCRTDQLIISYPLKKNTTKNKGNTQKPL